MHYLGVRVEGPSPNIGNISETNPKLKLRILEISMQLVFYYLAFCIANQPESKLMTLINKIVSITFESVNISELGKVKKLKLFEIELLRRFYLHKV